MNITLSIETVQPLSGTVVREGRAPLRFEGWLELLHAIAVALGERGGPAQPVGDQERGGVT